MTTTTTTTATAARLTDDAMAAELGAIVDLMRRRAMVAARARFAALMVRATRRQKVALHGALSDAIAAGDHNAAGVVDGLRAATR